MLAILSPSKTLSDQDLGWTKHTTPELLDDAATLFDKMRSYSVPSLQKLMGVSDKIATLNVERFRAFSLPLTPANALPALSIFKGDCYFNFDLEHYSDLDLDYAQGHLRILSGIYGVLRPLDLVFPYRLEMGTRLSTQRGKDLYAFWGGRVTTSLRNALQQSESGVLVNLASNEYYKAVRPAELGAEVVQPIFLDYKNGAYKTITLFTKRARGAMASAIMRQRLRDLDTLKAWVWDDYTYSDDDSHAAMLVWKRRRE